MLNKSFRLTVNLDTLDKCAKICTTKSVITLYLHQERKTAEEQTFDGMEKLYDYFCNDVLVRNPSQSFEIFDQCVFNQNNR